MTIQNVNYKSFLQTKCGWVNVRDGTHTKAFEMNYKVTEMKKNGCFCEYEILVIHVLRIDARQSRIRVGETDLGILHTTLCNYTSNV